MKPLIVLLAVFVVALLSIKIFQGTYDVSQAGTIAMSAMLFFTAIAHFAFTKGMVMMLPEFIPYKKALVYFTGVIEVAAGICFLVPQLKVVTGWFLILFFIVLLPANIYAALKSVNYQTGSYDGSGPTYLRFRVPLQIFFIVWTYLAMK